jgi:putative membrane protein
LFFQIVLFTLLGVGLGVVAGLVPGLHVNITLPLLFTASTFIGLDPYSLAVLIVATAITEVFVDFVLAIFLGAPDADVALSVLPGHRLLIEGRGYEAVRLAVIGGVGGLIFSLLTIVLLAGSFRWLYEMSRPHMHYFLTLVILLMIFSERRLRRMGAAALIIGLSGLLGVLVLNSAIVPPQRTLFPTLTGLFGLSTLAISLVGRVQIPQQQIDTVLRISSGGILKSIVLGGLAGVAIGFLPAIGVSEAATAVQYLGGAGEVRSFLVTLGSINTANDIFSLISLYLVYNPRSGASVAIQRILGELTLADVLLLVGVMCFATGIAAPLTLCLARRIPKWLEKFDYGKVCLSVIIFVTVLIALLTGPLGLLIAFTSTAMGLLCARLGIRRSHCMGVLLLPSIFFFAGLNPAIISLLGI